MGFGAALGLRDQELEPPSCVLARFEAEDGEAERDEARLRVALLELDERLDGEGERNDGARLNGEGRLDGERLGGAERLDGGRLGGAERLDGSRLGGAERLDRGRLDGEEEARLREEARVRVALPLESEDDLDRLPMTRRSDRKQRACVIQLGPLQT